jgi:adenosylhomocysteine nucleosidase
MAGLAGALDPTLVIGDLVVDRTSGLLVAPGPWLRGDIHTAADVVDTVEKKSALFRATGALVVDMENAIARGFADDRGVPFLGLRAVSDRADEPLDPATLRWVDDAGMPRLGRLAADLCRRPGNLPALWRLGRRSGLAVRSLARAVGLVVSRGQIGIPHDPVPSRSEA